MCILELEHKQFVVQCLARHHSLSETRDMLKEEYNIEADTAQLARYNPCCKAGAALSPELKKQFAQDRAAFEQGDDVCPINLSLFRQRELLDMYRLCKSKKNYAQAARLLEQAAKEAGGMYERAEEAGDVEATIKELLAQLAEAQTQAATPASAGNRPRRPRKRV